MNKSLFLTHALCPVRFSEELCSMESLTRHTGKCSTNHLAAMSSRQFGILCRCGRERKRLKNQLGCFLFLFSFLFFATSATRLTYYFYSHFVGQIRNIVPPDWRKTEQCFFHMPGGKGELGIG